MSIIRAAAAAALTLLALPAVAADFGGGGNYGAPTQPYTETPTSGINWQGVYAGVHAGGTWLNSRNTEGGVGAWDTNTAGMRGGVFGGYNHMVTPNVMAGVEADLTLGDVSKTRATVAGRRTNAVDATGTARGRLGVVYDRVMPYATGGIAMSSTTGGREEKTRLGYVLGAGVEGAVTNNVVVRGEYLYGGFGRESYASGPATTRVDMSTHTFRAGVGYKF